MQQQHMSHLLPIVLLLATLGGAAGGRRTSSVIRSTCTAVAKSRLSTPYPYCVLTLSTNPAAAAARDAHGLATAAAEFTAANVTRTIAYFNELIRGLQDCVTTYQFMQGLIDDALVDISAGRLDSASFKLKAAFWQPDYCDHDLMEMINKSPIREENDANSLLSALAYDIADFITPKPAPPPLPR